MTKCGFENLFPSSAAIVNAHQFVPCGFSFNAIEDKFWGTMHVTPEDAFSYVSYEANDLTFLELSTQQLLGYFQPERAVIICLSPAPPSAAAQAAAWAAAPEPGSSLDSALQSLHGAYSLCSDESAVLATDQMVRVACLARS